VRDAYKLSNAEGETSQNTKRKPASKQGYLLTIKRDGSGQGKKVSEGWALTPC
jgi:hypothetical protein